MNEQVGWRGFLKSLKEEAPRYAILLPQIPRLLHQRLNENPAAQYEAVLRDFMLQQRKRNFWLMLIALAAIIATCSLVLRF